MMEVVHMIQNQYVDVPTLNHVTITEMQLKMMEVVNQYLDVWILKQPTTVSMQLRMIEVVHTEAVIDSRKRNNILS